MRRFTQTIAALATGAAISFSFSSRAASALDSIRAQSMRKALANAIENRPNERRTASRTSAVSSVSYVGVAYYSAQLSNFPPLPFSPFPDLPVYKVGEGRFVYDDREVDYDLLRREAMVGATVDADQPGEAGGPGDPPAAPDSPPNGLFLLSVDWTAPISNWSPAT